MRSHPDIDVNWTPLHLASSYGHSEVVKLLLAHPNIIVNLKNKDTRAPLSYGCEKGHVSVVEVLKDPRVDVTTDDSYGSTPLWYASYDGKREVIEWLIASGRELGNFKNQKGNWDGKNYTALEIARKRNKTEAAPLLKKFIDNPTRLEVCVKLGGPCLDRFPV